MTERQIARVCKLKRHAERQKEGENVEKTKRQTIIYRKTKKHSKLKKAK